MVLPIVYPYRDPVKVPAIPAKVVPEFKLEFLDPGVQVPDVGSKYPQNDYVNMDLYP